jgi:hypothetical protein
MLNFSLPIARYRFAFRALSYDHTSPSFYPYVRISLSMRRM